MLLTKLWAKFGTPWWKPACNLSPCLCGKKGKACACADETERALRRKNHEKKKKAQKNSFGGHRFRCLFVVCCACFFFLVSSSCFGPWRSDSVFGFGVMWRKNVHFAFCFCYFVLAYAKKKRRERELGMRKVKEERVCDALACWVLWHQWCYCRFSSYDSTAFLAGVGCGWLVEQ